MPPPRVMPPTPVVEMMPLGVASPKACGGVVQVAQQRAALDPGGARDGIDADAVHRREIDHQPVVDGAQARRRCGRRRGWPARSVVVAGEVDRGDDVGDVVAADDERRVLVDHRVVDVARLVIAGIAWLDDIAAQ